MRKILLFFIIHTIVFAYGQVPLYQYRTLVVSEELPPTLTTHRSLVILSANDTGTVFTSSDWKNMAREAHQSLRQMSIDPVVYVSQNTLLANKIVTKKFISFLSFREIKNVIFLTSSHEGIEFFLTVFSNNDTIVTNQSEGFMLQGPVLNDVMFSLAKKLKSKSKNITNYLIPEYPNYVEAISIIEKRQIQKYPTRVKSNVLAIEKFAEIPIPQEVNYPILDKINQYNCEIEKRNQTIDTLMKDYPYKYVLVDYMNDDDLLRNRYQFVLRNVYGSTSTILNALAYPKESNIKNFEKTSSIHTPIYKFYIRQNISKYHYVGQWDADENWEQAFFQFKENLLRSFWR